jgi:hypothetical protein
VQDVIQDSGEKAAPTVEQVYARLGGSPRCGRCVLHVKDLINRAREKRAPGNAS